MSETLPDGWKKVRFGDVVDHKMISEKNPLENGLERFVGLDHIDPGDLQIKRWGMIEDGTTFTKVFQKGQLLFGRRRAYQRKVALADFAGICSGDILIFEAIPERLIPELLPFIVQSESFYEFALTTSAGSLSPRTKWSHLKNYEFLLPPLNEQRKIAEILWAVEECIRSRHNANEMIEKYKACFSEHVLSHGFCKCEKAQHDITPTTTGLLGKVPQTWTVVGFRDISKSYKNGLYKTSDHYGKGYPCVRMYNIVNGRVNTIKSPLLDVSDKELQQFGLETGDLLINRVNSPDLVGKAGIIDFDIGTATFESKNIRVRLDQAKVNPTYLSLFVQSKKYLRQVKQMVKAAIAQSTLNQSDLDRVKIPLPSLVEQNDIVDVFNKISTTLEFTSKSIESLNYLKTRLLNDLLSGKQRLRGDTND